MNKIQKLQTPKTKTQPTPVQKVLAKIAEDARQDAPAYLKETIVPEGGE